MMPSLVMEPAVHVKGQEPLTPSMLAAAPLLEQKQLLGTAWLFHYYYYNFHHYCLFFTCVCISMYVYVSPGSPPCSINGQWCGVLTSSSLVQGLETTWLCFRLFLVWCFVLYAVALCRLGFLLRLGLIAGVESGPALPSKPLALQLELSQLSNLLVGLWDDVQYVIILIIPCNYHHWLSYCLWL